MLKSILAIFAGIIAAASLVFVGEGVAHAMFPPPPGLDVTKPEDLHTLFEKLPLGATLSVLVSWAVAAFFGGGVAAVISRAVWPALAVGFTMLAIAGWTMIEIPHPLWFMLLSVPATLGPAAFAGRLSGKPPASRSTPVK